MKVREIMTTQPLLLHTDQSIKEAVKLLLQSNVDGAPVVNEHQELLGLLTKRDAFRVIEQEINLQTKVGQLMTPDPVSIDPDGEIGDLMLFEHGPIPVVENNTVVGVVYRTDLAMAFYNSFHTLSNELDTIINSTYNIIVSVDVEGRIKVYNQSAERFLGAKGENVIGKNIMGVFPDSGMVETVKTGRVESLQKFQANGRMFLSNRTPIRQNGQIVGAVAVLQDISEFEEVSKELKYVKELNEEMDAIIDSSFDGLYITDGEGKTLRLNKAFEMITGIDSAEFLHRNVEDIENDGIVSESVSKLTLRERKTVTIVQKTKTGKTTLVTGSPVFDKNGCIFRVVCNVRDITELNLLRQKLDQAKGLSQHYENQLRTLRLQYLGSDSLVISSNAMRNLMETVLRLAQVDTTVLITGESGTGKELIAENIHNNSFRKNQPFIKVNCGAIPANLLESELFGYEYGAFSGAKKGGKVGYFELANGGTLFLDEIGDIPFDLQVKLLRALQSKEINRVGGGASFEVNVRILTATNRNLHEMVVNKEFREDLYYRLNVVPINIPPLRARKEDIPPLVAHFMQLLNRKYSVHKRLSPEVINIFMDWNWPGNVRELENLIERLVVVTPGDMITRAEIPSYLEETVEAISSLVLVRDIVPLKEAVESTEKQLLEKAYARYKTTRQMASALKVNASTVVRKAARYGLNVKDKIY